MDHEILKTKDIQRKTNNYQDGNKNEVKFRGQIPVEEKHENNTQRMQITITERK